MSDPSPDRGQLVATIAQRLAALRERIAQRTDRDVQVVCVTKGHPPEVAAAAFDAGCVDLAENYAQELLTKQRELDFPAAAEGGPRWHFVGRLQSNKVRQLAPWVHLWQSVDRASLAREISRRAPGARVLVQLDLAGMPGRGGCPPDEAPSLVAACRDLGLDVVGLMGVGVPGPPELSREPFTRLVRLADELDLPVRSIGMSGDVDVAVDAGATMVRIGSALVGERPAPGRA